MFFNCGVRGKREKRGSGGGKHKNEDRYRHNRKSKGALVEKKTPNHLHSENWMRKEIISLENRREKGRHNRGTGKGEKGLKKGGEGEKTVAEDN